MIVKSRRAASSRASPKTDRLGPSAVEVGPVAPERGDLDLARRRPGPRTRTTPKLTPDRHRPPEQAHDLLGRGVGGDVVVARLVAEEQVADAPAGPERLEPGAAEPGHDLGGERPPRPQSSASAGPSTIASTAASGRLGRPVADGPDRDLRPAVAADVPGVEVGQDLLVELPARLGGDDRPVGQRLDEPSEQRFTRSGWSS